MCVCVCVCLINLAGHFRTVYGIGYICLIYLFFILCYVHGQYIYVVCVCVVVVECCCVFVCVLYNFNWLVPELVFTVYSCVKASLRYNRDCDESEVL